MVIIRLMGGLGNQMFQYAFGRSLLEAGREVKYDLSFYEQGSGKDTPRDYMLGLFPITVERADAREIGRLYDCEKRGKRIYRKLTGRNASHVRWEDQSRYMSELCGCDERYLIGFWQKEDYFSSVQGQLRKEFSFPVCAIGKKNEEMARQIAEDTHAVSLHVRGTDYLSEKNRTYYSGICTPDYYRSAMQYFVKRDSDSRFYVFSDDAAWAKEVLDGGSAGEQMAWIDWNRGGESWIDMYLMSLCHNHIIANSSFSWWGAWLGCNADRQVVGPDRWDNTESGNAVMPASWIHMQGKECLQ